MKLTKAEKIALKAFLDEYEASFCGTRVGHDEDDEDAYFCRACPMSTKTGLCNLRLTRNKLNDVQQK